MRIFAMFGAYYGRQDDIELLDAWDEYSREENENGYEEACEKWAKDSDLAAFAVVQLDVDEDDIRRALFPATVTTEAAVVPSASREGVTR